MGRPSYLTYVGLPIRNCPGGEGGIRTPDTLADIHDFESCAFDHSATSPWFAVQRGYHFC